MSKRVIAVTLVFAFAAIAQKPSPRGSGGGGTGTANKTASFASSATSVVLTHSLGTTTIDPGLVQCYTGTTTRTPLAVTSITSITTSQMTINFSAAPAAGVCSFNSSGVNGTSGTNGTNGEVTSVVGTYADGQMVVSSGTTGDVIKPLTGSGVVKIASGVASVVSGTATDCVKVDGSSGACGTGGGGGATDFSGLTGTATDAQIPNNITIDLATAATALAANGANCSTGQAAGGVDASGTSENCINLAATYLTIVSASSSYQPLAQILTDLSGLTLTDDSLLVSNGSTLQVKTVPDCSNASASKLLYTASTNSFSCGTDQTGGGGGGSTAAPYPVTMAGSAQTVNYTTHLNQGPVIVKCVDSSLQMVETPYTLALTGSNYNVTIGAQANGTCWIASLGSGVGTVTAFSVASLPSWLSSSVATSTTTPALTITAATGQTANRIMATPDGTTGAISLRALVSADLPTASIDGSVGYCADAGANDTYTCSLSPAPGSYVTGARYRFKANTANTGAASINFNSLGAKTIVKVAGGITTTLADNDIRAGQLVDVVYDGTNMQIQSTLGNAPAGSGTVTVVGAGALTSTALVTGGGTTTLQTPSATSTLDSSGNMSLAGAISTGVGGSAAGYLELTQGTTASAGTTSIRIQAPTSVTSYVRTLPGSAATGFYLGTNSAGVVTDTQVASSGTGSVCLTTNCAMTTPNLGTPSSVTLTNGVGLPVSTGITGLGTGVATFLATPSSANLASALTDETGSGPNVFGTGPTLTGPVIATSTVAGLPTASSNSGKIYVVTDGNAAGSCTTGGGSSIVLCRSNGSAWAALGDGGSGGGGTVSSVGQTFTGGLISVSGSPVTTSGTLALTVAGTSGGIPYFSSGSTWNSSSALSSGAVVTGGGAGGAPSASTLTASVVKMTSGVPSAATAGTDYMSSTSTETKTGLTLDVEGSGNQITTVQKIWLEAAACAGTTGSLMWDTLATNAPTATCSAGTTETTMMRGTADFPDSDGDYSLQRTLMLPSDWTGNIDVVIKYKTAATSGNTVWQVATACRADAEVDDVAFNTADALTADAAKGTTLQLNDASKTNITTTGCAAGELMHLKVFRNRTHASDTITGVVSLVGVEVTTRRLQ